MSRRIDSRSLLLVAALVFAFALLAVDSDGDDLFNGFELLASRTGVLDSDTDADGMSDGFEISTGLDPHDPADVSADPDSDGLTNLQEFSAGTHPRREDTDGDRLNDDVELSGGTDPRVADTDADGLPDGVEVMETDTSPTDPDHDQDGLLDGEEVARHQTDPKAVDSDRDLLSDGFEVRGGLEPTEATDPHADPDADGLTHLQEQIYGTNPLAPDSDGDGTPDGTEVAEHQSPTIEGSPAGGLVRLRFTVGDHSGSESERYHLNVGGVSHQAMEFGVLATNQYVFERGRSYTISIVHAGTKLDTPDFDYTALIEADEPGAFRIEDPDGLLGKHHDRVEGDAFFPRGRSATLVLPAATASTPAEAGGRPSVATP